MQLGQLHFHKLAKLNILLYPVFSQTLSSEEILEEEQLRRDPLLNQ